MDCSFSAHTMSDPHNTIARPGVIVAAASSSSIGDLSINDDLAEVTVEKLVNTGVFSRPTEEPVVLVSVTAKESTPENLVSSTSGE